ncbi:tetratricopeptide repeat protein [Allorhodopirellula solitaria]|uniref:Tetratricopeptide repeat protein n=1 Tax=Allorhodopirellula solitaria TaxID=2527987 RepID=A0A5C5YG51_9BACT|nr:tetratricopeptide repeat protein [Allorhodopirellula solitaria]TWT73345.1 Tetratricopeptide repeat protein [Allorhodopirellula solitaria]
MLRFTWMLPAIMLVAGCHALPQIPRPDSRAERPEPTSEAPMSQLGAPLPAMRAGDERELKVVAADQMTKQGYWDEAVELYLEAEAMAPKKPRLDAQLAPALAGARQYPESIRRYRRLIEDDPTNASLLSNLAYTLEESGDTAAAEEEFQRALAIDPDLENTRVNLGLLLARQRRYDEALTVLTPAIGAPAAHHNLGVIAIELDDETAAKQHFARAASYPTAPAATQEFIAALSTDRHSADQGQSRME